MTIMLDKIFDNILVLLNLEVKFNLHTYLFILWLKTKYKHLKAITISYKSHKERKI